MSSLKSKTVLKLNVQYLAQLNCARCCTFWTFTLPEVISPVDAAERWRYLAKDLVRYLGFKGVRVFELHPGGHGLHVHACAVGAYPIRHVLDICKKHGWGRVGVERVHSLDSERIGLYLGKYLIKCKRLWHGISLKGMRWWATFGKVRDKVRIGDVRVDSPFARLYRAITFDHVKAVFHYLDLSSIQRINFLRYKLASKLYVGDDFGPWRFWLQSDPHLYCVKSWSALALIGGVK